MRVLVEQTQATIEGWLRHEGLLWDGHGDHAGKIGVHVLMGGSDAGDWHLHPEHPAILIGTQDMLISRALNRGYGSGRARWPTDFGLINQDALWVVDEVQLMDVGLATTVQLQAFREQDASLRPCRTWWMSATLQPSWLESVDTRPLLAALSPILTIPPVDRHGALWSVTKPVCLVPVDGLPALAALAREAHQPGQITLVVVNRVEDAVAVRQALAPLEKTGVELRLVHSRFRPYERQAWRTAFLTREAPRPPAGRIIIATQVVEAGVDISAEVLITALAPWPSLVQRFGRCARYGGTGTVLVADAGTTLEDAKTAAPYLPGELAASRQALSALTDVAPGPLDVFEAALSAEQRAELYPYAPDHLLLRRELDELFDISTDLSGADLDIGRFIRSGDERDCAVWWHPVAEETPSIRLQPSREALCAVPFLKVRKWLFGTDRKRKHPAWTVDYLSGGWRALTDRDCRPGQVILVEAAVGGYDPIRGFTGEERKPTHPMVPLVPAVVPSPEDQADATQDSEDLSIPVQGGWQSIATHGGAVGDHAQGIATHLGLGEAVCRWLGLAGRLHDWGKVHPAFRACIASPHAHHDLAKAPQDAWVVVRDMYQAADGLRRGFRHELASTLAMFELLAQVDRHHPALLGGCADLIAAGVLTPALDETGVKSGPLAAELHACDAETFDLIAYLICSHHGKVRVSWHPSPDDQDFATRDDRGMPLRGIREGDVLPGLPLLDGAGSVITAPDLTLHLDAAHLGLSSRYGRSWRERTADLQRRHGPFALAFLEACLRAADIRASRSVTADPLLETQP